MTLDSREFRDALGSFVTGVCVVTALNETGNPFGITVNSFAAVSLDPALVLWSLQNNSECYAAFEKAEKFAVNILSAKQQDLSNLYAKKSDHLLEAEHFKIGRSGTPVLNDVVTVFECDVWARNAGGDHMIFIGEVTSMRASIDKKPLLFAEGKYQELA